MNKINFENVRMALGDQNRDLRLSLIGILRQKGFHNVVHSGTMPVLDEMVAASKVDLMVCDAELPEGDFCTLVRDIRHNRKGRSPFVVVIALASEPTAELVRNIVSSGVDDLIIKPITAGKVAERIENLTRSRKDFVVTTDYIGPDRRKGGPRPGSQEIPTLEVPNPLAVKTSGGNLADMEAKIQEVMYVINEQKVERHAFQIEYLVNQIMPIYKAGASKALLPLVKRLVLVSADIKARLETTKYVHVSQLCETVHEVAVRINKNPLRPDRKDVALLPNLAQAVNMAFAADPSNVQVVKDITESVRVAAR